ncbi:transporter substrate-binding domain-containing protein [Streptococcus ruminicola]|uniref:Transporter substrate-binding domain-containing protein n=1 Tax=Streptococcus ruminicola TaxID=2686210 RepID=A0A6G8I2F3_9STRE|nr:transporter substrate-binding domain-containing protein [Streptococcus ruminicola]QIM47290.1 transporter substrate-binding domain-containing protein [Streptococcus ruminicola]SEP96165.1 amino acid ABC transporter substrate-binding protein, PAAT family [Streptococcus equinus]
MSKKKWIISGGVVLAIVAATVVGRQLTGKTSASADSSQSSSDKVTTLQVAHTQNYVPYDFVNDKGESDGFEVAVLKAVDDKLKNYKFEYTGTSDEDLLIGLESGKYDIGVKGAWYTEERAQKFVIPDQAIGASVIGFAVRKSDENKYKDIDSFAKAGGKLVPISPQNAQYNVIQEYNKKAKHPIELKESESFSVADAYAWVLEGRYDAYFSIKLSFEEAVQKEDGAYHQYADQLTWFPYKGIETYPLIHKNDTNKAFAKEYDKAIKELQKDGTIAKLSEKYFGEDVFSYVTD